MTKLYLLRHGIATPPGVIGTSDGDRPLTAEGEKHMRQIARGLRRLDPGLERIFSSPLRRAAKTAEIVADALDMTDRLEFTDALHADRDAASIRDWVKARPEGCVMLVGHNPSLSDLIGLLITGQPGVVPLELRKGGIAALSAMPGLGMRLDWLARPRLFRRLCDD